ncbi:MAG: hypothetical protein MK095_08165 [Phycisphaerales bacterium]|nr:hypothetical protein [Phycisphaerales bacterium]
MSTAATRAQNNIKAGVFVSIAILIGLSVIFILGDFKKLFQSAASEYNVTFPVSEGIAGLGEGSFVEIGGIQIGEVKSVTFKQGDAGPLKLINVRFAIPADIPVYSGAVVSVQSGMLSTSSWLNFSSMGEGGDALEPGSTFSGSTMSMLDTLMGSGPATSLSSVLESFAVITTQIESNGELLKWALGDDQAVQIDSTIMVLQEAIGQGNVFLSELNTDWANWSGDIDALMAQADDFALALQNVSNLINDNAGTYQEIVDNIDSTVVDVSSVAEQLRNTTWPKVEAFVDTAQTTLAEVEEVVLDVTTRAAPWLADINRTLANLMLASQQLNQLLTEVKTSPWRLLYRPTDAQMGQELIYEASRNFVFGAADLKSAAQAMQRVIDARGGALAPDDPQMEQLRTNLLDSANRYQRAQDQLMDVLRGEGDQSP